MNLYTVSNIRLPDPSDPDASLNVLRTIYGYEAFRGQQREIVDSAVAGRDMLVLMPTGGGKSLCYQIPALLRAGTGIVISPLIALMQDQVSALQQLGIRAAFLNSTLSGEQQSQIERALLDGELDLLYIAPERLVQERTLQMLSQSTLALFAIDEAHCVSQWGHDFRSDYLALSMLAQRFADVPRLALTATADQRTRQEIVQRLNLHDPRIFVAGFDRPNIRYSIAAKVNPRKQLLAFLENRSDQAGIVYCMSRRKVEETARWLAAEGYTALPYHAGLSAELRQQHQTRFLRDEAVIIVATIAFGMGIDKPDVRFVAHLDLPRSIEAYYQETGRAGRDGEPAEAWMVYGLQDVVRLQQMQADGNGEAAFRRSERMKLDAMLGLCEVTSCRRQVLLHYFGEDAPTQCGNCDNCQIPPSTWDATEAARKLLSAVYRTGQRFGVAHVLDVLRGRETDKMLQHGHHQLSTFGIGNDISEARWRSLARQLVVRGFLQVDVEGYNALQLTERCRPLLKGELELHARIDQEKAPSRKAAQSRDADQALGEQDEPLWQALKACRSRLANEQDIPAYRIFHDATLREMVRQKPMSRMEMLAISGVGESKLEKFGGDFIEVICRHEEVDIT